MTTSVRAKISEKNKYHINKHRHYELKHFCLQYPKWKIEYSACSDIGPKIANFQQFISGNTLSDPTAKSAMNRYFYLERIKMIELAAKQAGGELREYILKAVTEGRSYTYLRNTLQMPCSRDIYYEIYRKFFWILDKLRD